MKKKDLLKLALCGLFLATLNSGCKKKETTTPTPVATVDESPEQKQNASDQSQAENETNQSIDDANTALNGTSNLRSASAKLICNAIIDSSKAKTKGLLSISYNGKTADSLRVRSGYITIQLDTTKKWHTAGATVTITFNNYKVTRISDNKSIIFNGTHTIVNVNGGTIATLALGQPLVHKIRGTMRITFDDGTQRTWNVARIRTFNYLAGIVTETLSGDTLVNNYANVAMWGTNRKGDIFYVSTPTPISANILGGVCLLKPFGIRIHYVGSRTLTVTYGVDAQGASVPPTTCPYGYKLNWLNAKGATQEVVVAY